MTCELAKKNAALFLYGELTIEEEQAFQDHIEACAECGREFETEKRVQAALNRNEVAIDPALLVRSRRELGLRLENARMRRAGLGAWLRRLSDLRNGARAEDGVAGRRAEPRARRHEAPAASCGRAHRTAAFL